MSELEQLMKQQVSLLQKQVEQQEEVLTQLTNYSLQLVEQNELLMQENKEKSALITTLKDELSNLKLKPLSDEQLKDFSKTSNRILQQQLQAVLTQKNIQSMSESIISNQVESQLSPYIKQLSAMISDLSVQISDLSDMASSSSIETDLNRLDGRLQELTTSVTTLEEHLNRLMA